MKRKMAILLAAVTLMSATACADRIPVIGKAFGEKKTEEVVVDGVNSAEQDSSTEAEVGTQETVVPDGTDTSLEGTSEAADAASVTEENTEGEAPAQTDAQANTESSSEADVATNEIVEPEMVQPEVVQPVEESAPPVAEAPVEDDKVMDIVFMGDSQFDNARGTGSEIPAYTCHLLDNVRYSNLAIGGTAASLERGHDPDAGTMTDSCFIGLCYALAGKVIDTSFVDKYPAGEELKNIDPSKVDLYVIEYGANDYINGKDLRNPDDNYDIHSYKGALTVGIETLKSISPNAKFLICGPSYCMWYNADGYVIGDSYTVSKGIGTLSEYADICGNLADEEGITYMDTMYATYFDLKITTVDDYLSDGLHYNEKGRQIYATALAHFIKKTMGIDDPELQYMEIGNFEYKF